MNTREAITANEAAGILRCGTANIYDLKKRGKISGPDPEAGSRRVLVWRDEVEARFTPKRGRRVSDRQVIEGIQSTLRSIDNRLGNLESRVDIRSTTIAAMLGVQDELETAVKKSDETTELVLRAMQTSQESKQALSAAGKLRDEIVRQVLIPDTMPDS